MNWHCKLALILTRTHTLVLLAKQNHSDFEFSIVANKCDHQLRAAVHQLREREFAAIVGASAKSIARLTPQNWALLMCTSN